MESRGRSDRVGTEDGSIDPGGEPAKLAQLQQGCSPAWSMSAQNLGSLLCFLKKSYTFLTLKVKV